MQIRGFHVLGPPSAQDPKARNFQVNYLLDTNACIALINDKPMSVRSRFQKAVSAGSQIFVSSITAFELWYGVRKSSREEFNTRRLQTFLAGPIITLPFEDEDAAAAGSVRAFLETSGKPIGAYDLLVAGQALQRQLTLVTANVAEFSRVKGLVWQDWAKS
jgi:tRNA(fMet)-specific endonuclease VapC